MFETTFKALGEPTRLKILRLLAEQELCVCELEEILDMSQPRVSQHLKVLKQAGLVKERREAQRKICSFDREALDQVFHEFNIFMKVPVYELPEFQEMYVRMINLDENICEKKAYQKKTRGSKPLRK
ncbi:MAG TPA: winged helix-turn-helix transcriptional regulator [Gelria sp.]|jgi:ArsR family transcriptional regulator|nr:winged helix-turn-helix transcriptional regulator [Gelria sp.]